MLSIPIFLIICGFLFGILQVVGVINFKNSQMSLGWLIGAGIFVVMLILMGTLSNSSSLDKSTYLYLLLIAFWCNLIKFTLGFVQKKEKALYNRFEHFATGFLLFYGLELTGFVTIFPIIFQHPSAVAFFILLTVNLVSVGIEMGELLVDIAMRRNYMIGPGVHDTNWDLLLTFLGSVMGYLIFR